jgi:hypothetical protein
VGTPRRLTDPARMRELNDKLLLSKISETAFERKIMKAAKLRGWLVTHFRPAQSQSGNWLTPLSGDPGFVDLVMCKPPWLIMAELKSERGTVSPEQRTWGLALSKCPGVFYAVWKPRHWALIDSILEHGPPGWGAEGELPLG